VKTVSKAMGGHVAEIQALKPLHWLNLALASLAA
jgi:hypothetical protein